MLINKHLQIYFVTLVIAILSTSCSQQSDRPYLNKKHHTIGLQRAGDIPSNILKLLKHEIARQYGTKVVILPNILLPDSFINYDKGKRYAANAVIQYLKVIKPDSVDYIAGITNEDIYTIKKDKRGNIKKPESKYKVWGIFGLGYKPGESCIISIARLRATDQQQYLKRIIKITLHEIGHNHGLDHCPDKKCLMTDAVETIQTIDDAQTCLCVRCFNRIK